MANSSSRGNARVIWCVIHTAEGIRKASDLKAFFERSTDSSAHACADDTTLLDNLVPYDRAAWTIRGGNTRSDNLELCGFAAWSRDEWLRNHQGMLHNAATWIRNRCRARGIPIRKLDPAAVGRGEAGVIGHVDYTLGTGDGTHTDPGKGFPWDTVIALASQATTEQGGIESMALDTSFKDWAGNNQTVQSWMNHVDERLSKLEDALLGRHASRIEGDANQTNVPDLVFDSARWTFEDKATLADIQHKLDQLLQG